MTNYQLITLALQALGFGALIYQAGIAIVSIKADHERRRKQATIEQVGNEYRACRYALEDRFGTKSLTDEDIAKIQEDKEYEATIVRLLAVLEHIAVGVNTGIYDEEIVFRMSSTSMIGIFKRLEPYIRYRQRNYNEASYIEFNHLVKEFEGRKLINPSNKGNINFS